ncbi:hypothetical protein C8R43DRAFT_934221 [Mycena crocata]|nr:hypothetical protein C8R43DRAFT_934221 [Mycena crocata]
MSNVVNLLPQLSESPPLNATTLPTIPPFDPPQLVSAYRRVVDAEKEAVDHYGRATTNLSKEAARYDIVAVRVVGYLFPSLWRMRHCLGDQPTVKLAVEVLSAVNDSALHALGKRYIDHLICSFRTTTSKSDTPSNHPSRPSMDRLEDMLMDAIQVSGNDHRSARTRALARDGYQCMVTNTVDAFSFEKHPAVKKICSEKGAAVHNIQTCHIFNEAKLQELKDGDRLQNAGAALAILKMFGLESVVERLTTIVVGDTASASGVHNLLNIISLITELHTAFDTLKMIFEPVVDQENTYDIVFAYPQRALGLHGLKNRVTLTSLLPAGRVFPQAGGVRELPLPDPRLLALHAVCARVAHMSGAAEALDSFERDVEETLVLARDGASANLVDRLLSPLVFCLCLTLYMSFSLILRPVRNKHSS